MYNHTNKCNFCIILGGKKLSIVLQCTGMWLLKHQKLLEYEKGNADFLNHTKV